MNVRAEEVVLKAKTNVANLQPVTVLGTIPGKGIKEAESTQLKVVESEREIAEFIEELVNTVHESVPDSTRSALRDILLRVTFGRLAVSDSELGVDVIDFDECYCYLFTVLYCSLVLHAGPF